MKTLNYVLVALVSFGFVACSDDSGSPTSPSAVPAPSAAAPAFRSSAAGTVQPASVDTLRPGGGNTDFNAYDFTARHADGMLHLVLMEDEMRQMRTASQPHRQRMITVGVCQSEPHHAGEWCGDPIWQGSMVLSGTVNLDPIPLDSCPGWIVVQAAELSDDKYDGYRNAPCPTGTGMTRSDGTGSGWSSYPTCDVNGQPEGLCVPAEPEPAPTTPEPTTPTPTMPGDPSPTPKTTEQIQAALDGGVMNVGAEWGLHVNIFFNGTSGTTADDYRITSSSPDVVETTSEEEYFYLSASSPGTATITITYPPTNASVSFTLTVRAAETPQPRAMIPDCVTFRDTLNGGERRNGMLYGNHEAISECDESVRVRAKITWSYRETESDPYTVLETTARDIVLAPTDRRNICGDTPCTTVDPWNGGGMVGTVLSQNQCWTDSSCEEPRPAIPTSTTSTGSAPVPASTPVPAPGMMNLTGCVNIEWTETGNRPFGLTDFYYNVENTCSVPIRVYWRDNDDSARLDWQDEFQFVYERVIFARTTETHEVEGGIGLNRFGVFRDINNNPEIPETRYCANNRTSSSIPEDENFCLTVTPRDLPTVGRSIRPGGITRDP